MQFILRHKKLAALGVFILIMMSVVLLASFATGGAQKELSNVVSPLQPYERIEQLTKREIYYLTQVKDERTWNSSRNNSTMDESVKQVVYGNKYEYYQLTLNGYTIKEILYTFKSKDGVYDTLVRIQSGDDVRSVFLQYAGETVVAFEIY